MERTLTAAAGPSPCDPYRHALARRPATLKGPGFCFNFLSPKAGVSKKFQKASTAATFVTPGRDA